MHAMAEPQSPVLQPASTDPVGPNWSDPNIPAGNAPPMPAWRLLLAAAAFGLWLVFLIAMALVRIRTTSH